MTLGVPFMRLTYDIDVVGAPNFGAVAAPCLIVSNHSMHPDWAMLLTSMPRGFRRRVILAAAADDIFGSRFLGLSASLVGNAFPFVNTGSNVRESLEFAAARLGEGWRILIFPEGELTVDGPMEGFKPGVGWLVAHTGVAVLPMRVEMLRPGIWDDDGRRFRRGRVRVSVGQPVRFDPQASYSEVTAALQEAVRNA